MNRKIIIVEGYLASGKSTFARSLSQAIGVPYFIKDTFKEALCASVEINSREVSSSFSAVTFDAMMYALERMIETGYPVIIEGNFVPPGVKAKDEQGAIKGLLTRYSCQSLTYKFMGDTQILYERFIQREKLPERGQANIMFFEPLYNDFKQWCQALDGFDVGGKITRVNTTDFGMVEFSKLVEEARMFINA